MIHFTAPLQLWNSTDGKWHFITVPEDFVGQIKAHSLGMSRGFGSVKVEVMVDDVIWHTSIFPMKAGGYLLPMKIASCREAGLAPGDDVSVMLELL